MSKRDSQAKIIALAATAIVLAGSGYYFMVAPKLSSTTQAPLEITEGNGTEAASIEAADATAVETSTENEAVTTETVNEEAIAPSTVDTTIDVARALGERAQGEPHAKVTITEHSSLTCGHCGAFHKETYPKLKAEYIDTGKVRLVFSDFPLNAPALHASMIARCLPETRHASFTQLLFETQDKWAYDASGYVNYLKQNAQLAGLSAEAFDSCLNNTELQDGMMKMRQETQEKHNISSTPSFVINGKTVISGALPYEELQKAINEALSAADSGTTETTDSPPQNETLPSVTE